MATLQELLDIEDALVTEQRPARSDGPLDYERCARLHNYLAVYGWMAVAGEHEQGLDELLGRPSFLERQADGDGMPLDRLDPALISFLERIILPDPVQGVFFWAESVVAAPADWLFFLDDSSVDGGKERFVIVYASPMELGSHNVGLVLDQRRHRAALPLAQENIDSVFPVEEHLDLWYPLETILSNWIYMLRIGKVTAGPSAEEQEEEGAEDMEDVEDEERRLTRQVAQIGAWKWLPYSAAQVDSTVAAMDRLSDAIEARMPPDSLIVPLAGDKPLLFTDAQLDAASVPKDCFIRHFLTRVRTPRFRRIAPGLAVPHDTHEFAAHQKFAGLPYRHTDGFFVPAVLIFAAAMDDDGKRLRTVGFNDELKAQFFTPHDDVPYADGHPIPAGLYSESVRRNSLDIAEEGFRLLLPFPLRPDIRDYDAARRSDGTLVDQGSYLQLFQHGHYYPCGGEWRAQRLERLLDRWRELIETGVWTIGRDGVQGTIDTFKAADHGAWQDYWIAPGW